LDDPPFDRARMQMAERLFGVERRFGSWLCRGVPGGIATASTGAALVVRGIDKIRVRREIETIILNCGAQRTGGDRLEGVEMQSVWAGIHRRRAGELDFDNLITL